MSVHTSHHWHLFVFRLCLRSEFQLLIFKMGKPAFLAFEDCCIAIFQSHAFTPFSLGQAKVLVGKYVKRLHCRIWSIY